MLLEYFRLVTDIPHIAVESNNELLALTTRFVDALTRKLHNSNQVFVDAAAAIGFVAFEELDSTFAGLEDAAIVYFQSMHPFVFSRKMCEGFVNYLLCSAVFHNSQHIINGSPQSKVSALAHLYMTSCRHPYRRFDE